MLQKSIIHFETNIDRKYWQHFFRKKKLVFARRFWIKEPEFYNAFCFQRVDKCSIRSGAFQFQIFFSFNPRKLVKRLNTFCAFSETSVQHTKTFTKLFIPRILNYWLTQEVYIVLKSPFAKIRNGCWCSTERKRFINFSQKKAEFFSETGLSTFFFQLKGADLSHFWLVVALVSVGSLGKAAFMRELTKILSASM